MMCDEVQYVVWGDGEYTTRSVRNPFARALAVAREDLMREDQRTMGEHGIDYLIEIQRIRHNAQRLLADQMLYGATYVDAEGNRIDPSTVAPHFEPGPLDRFFIDPSAP